MNIEQLFRNPTGTGTSFFVARTSVLEDFNQRLSKIMNREKNKTISVDLYDTGSNMIFHVMVPSETLSLVSTPFQWDVVIELPSLPKRKADFKTLDVRVFTNNIAFVMTDAYVYNQNKAFIDWLNEKVPEEAMVNKPQMRNPQQVLGFNKAIAFACIVLEEGMFIYGHGLKKVKRSKAYVKSLIQDYDEKVETYQILMKKQRELSKKLKQISKGDASEGNRFTGVVKTKVKKPKSFKRPVSTASTVKSVKKINRKGKRG